MKALTIHQPWANLIAHGAKQYETRSWRTNYRGRIAIHASKLIIPKTFLWAFPFPEDLLADALGIYRRLESESRDSFCERLVDSDDYGAVVATAELVDCYRIETLEENPYLVGAVHGGELSKNEIIFGNFEPGRYAYKLQDVRKLPEPIPARGRQGLWEWDDSALIPAARKAEQETAYGGLARRLKTYKEKRL